MIYFLYNNFNIIYILSNEKQSRCSSCFEPSLKIRGSSESQPLRNRENVR